MINVFSNLNFFHILRANGKIKKIIVSFIYILFGLSVSLIFALEKLKPFNYIIIVLWSLFSIVSLFYVLVYGKIKTNRYLLLVGAFIGLQVLSWVLNGFKSFNSTGILLGIMSLFVFELSIQDDFNPKIFFQLMLLGTWFCLIFFACFYYKSILSYKFGEKLVIVFGNSNDIARSISYCLVINYSFGLILKKKWLKPILFFASFVSFIYIFLIGSVSNLLVCILTIFIASIIIAPKRIKIIIFIASIVFVGLAIFLLKLPFMKYFNDRITGMITSFFGGSGKGDDSFVYRFRGAYYAMQLFLKRPFFGNGFDSVYRNYVIMAHNNIAEIASDFGVFALTIEEYFILFPLLKASFKKNCINRQAVLIIVPCLVFMFFFQFFLVSFNSKIECLILPLCFAFLFSERRKEILNDYYRVDI